MSETCAVCGRPKWHKDMETDPNESCDYATQSSWMESDPEGAKCYRLGYERQKDRADSCFVAMTLASDRATEAEEALAAARQECAEQCEAKDAAYSHIYKLRGALERCSELFSAIRGDWTDPRSECREGQDVIRAALAAPRAGEEGT